MLGDFQSAEFIELATDLLADGIPSQYLPRPETKYNPQTLRNEPLPSVPVSCKTFITTAPDSTTIKFDEEIDTEEFAENRILLCSYRGKSATGDKITLQGLGTFLITAIARTNPLGVVIVQRFKVSR